MKKRMKCLFMSILYILKYVEVSVFRNEVAFRRLQL